MFTYMGVTCEKHINIKIVKHINIKIVRGFS